MLKIYKAGAGSGKTFTLAAQYIKLVVKDPSSYRKILAVTFTNKATTEMKTRILSQLYGLWRQLPDSLDYMNKVMGDLDASPSWISQRAGVALSNILHNYSYFRVETIDTFFQSVLRNLARELDLTANMRIMLTDKTVESFAVDSIIEELEEKNEILAWITQYIQENIDEDKTRDVITGLKKFGLTIFKDFYRSESKKLNAISKQPDFMPDYFKRIKETERRAKEEGKDIASHFQTVLNSHGLTETDICNGKKGVAGYFLKMGDGCFNSKNYNKNVAKCADNADAWAKKNDSRRDYIAAIAKDELIPMLQDAERRRKVLYKQYMSARLTLGHLRELRLLGAIDDRVKEINSESNSFLLSDTPFVLNSLINESDTPFIYERIGAQIEHIMIDEFQDTGRMQWKNFRILLRETMSHGGSENLIVGDVKQSIYRWRDGDWRILYDIGSKKEDLRHPYTIKPLNINYRSCRRIVEFNNAFFQEAARREEYEQALLNAAGANDINIAYSDVKQQVPDGIGDEGYVSITLLNDDDYEQRTLNEILSTVKDLLSTGMPCREIAILVRYNVNIPVIANYLAEKLPEVPIVSDEAFRLDASTAVNMLVLAMRVITCPDDLLSLATLAKLYQKQVMGSPGAEYDLIARGKDYFSLLPPDFANTPRFFSLPLFELIERLYTLFQLERLDSETAYVCAFLDCVEEFMADNNATIDNLLEQWEETIRSTTIPSDEADGIRVMTIHKSKGLEYESIIAPFFSWKRGTKDPLWCRPTEKPFSGLPLVAVNYGQDALGTIYENDYLNECLMRRVDNLNLLYVAFTRARRDLYVIGKGEQKGQISELIRSTAEAIAESKKEKEPKLNGAAFETNPWRMTYGRLERYKEKAAGKSNNVFLQKSVNENVSIRRYPTVPAFRQSNESRRFINEAVNGPTTTFSNFQRQMGTVLHRVFYTIRTLDDVPRAIARLQQAGLIYTDAVSADSLREMIISRFNNKQVADWFSKRWRLLNECDIIFSDETTGQARRERPDRVMTDSHETIVVDFKFGQPNEEYHRQVEHYISLLRAMGMPSVRGYLWYVFENIIEEVCVRS